MAGVVEGFRWALLGTARAPARWSSVSASPSSLLLVGGARLLPPHGADASRTSSDERDTAIRAEGLGKRYRIGDAARTRYEPLARADLHAARRSDRASAPRTPARETRSGRCATSRSRSSDGEVVGIIGRNGAGKSTLLKILSRITEPTDGRAEIRGRVGSLLEVGTGFHPELTGRENIFLNGAILGMTQREIARKFDEIVAVRRGRAVHRHAGQALLERHVRAARVRGRRAPRAGDPDRRRGARRRRRRVPAEVPRQDGATSPRQGRTVLFVSHNMTAVSHLCPRAILLDSGRIVADGDTEEVVRRYLATAVDSDAIQLADRADRRGSGILRATSLAMRAADVGGAPRTGDATEIEIAYEAEPGERLENVAVVLGLDTAYGQRIMTLDTEMTGSTFDALASEGMFACSIPALTLNEGRYHVTVYITVNGVIADWVIKAGILTVHAGDFFDSGRALEPHDGLVVVDHTWRAH